MALSLVQTVAPTAEPLTLAEVKRYLRVDGTDDDVVIEALMVAAREEVETWTGLTLLTTTYALRLDDFPASGIIALPRAPLQSVTSVAYLDDSAVSQTLATTQYVANTYSMPGRVELAYSGTWPSTYAQYNAVTITFVAGFTHATLPERARMAMKLLIGSYYEQREAMVETRIYENPAVCRLLWGLRILEIA